MKKLRHALWCQPIASQSCSCRGPAGGTSLSGQQLTLHRRLVPPNEPLSTIPSINMTWSTVGLMRHSSGKLTVKITYEGLVRRRLSSSLTAHV